MNKKGFFIKRLSLTGSSGIKSEVEFEKGLNVIVGPTNTGKSYIFECINFMLGGKDTPDEIEEAKDYETAYLEIESYEGRTYTFERSLAGGGIKKYNCALSDVTITSKYKELSPRHGVNNKSLSEFLLSLSGFKETDLLVKKNQKNDLQKFTYRSYNDWILIDEITIITKRSPVESDSNQTKTAKESGFNLILTNKDDSEKVKKHTDNVKKPKYEAQIEMIDKIISELELNISTNEILESQDDLVMRIKELTKVKLGIKNEIDELSNLRKKRWNEIQRYETKVLTLNELLKRFQLLRTQYETDKKRITFLLEGEYYFSLLNFEKCPTCNQTINSNEESACSHLELEQKRESYNMEWNKIHHYQEDLTNTIETMEEEVGVHNDTLNKLEYDYGEISRVLDEELEPKFMGIETEIFSIIETQKAIDEAQQKENTLNTILSQKKGLLSLLGEESESQNEDIDVIDYSAYYNDLCIDIKYYLKGWNYEGHDKVEFNEKNKDIVISGKPRKLFGKGYRSISYSAFVLGVMRYCNSKNLPHPGFVVLDSPVTSYKEEDSDDDKSSDEVQENFFRFLAENSQSSQVIILENKKPSKEINKINLIEFTKSNISGRYGFITSGEMNDDQ